jgi:hypothetical protein
LCRSRGVQAATIDALPAQLCIRHELTLLTTDVDFEHIAKHTSLHIGHDAAPFTAFRDLHGVGAASDCAQGCMRTCA